MASRSSNQEIIAILTGKIGDLTGRVTYDNRNYLIKIDLSGLNLPQLPSEIGQLGSLQMLDLQNNQLSQLPPEIGQLGNLQMRNLYGNQLSRLVKDTKDRKFLT